MRTTSVYVFAALSTSALGLVAPRANGADTKSDVPAIPHPYWWEGPYSKSLNAEPYGSETPFPLPTLPSTPEEPCETETITPTPTPTPEPCETDTWLEFSSPIPPSSYDLPSLPTQSGEYEIPTSSYEAYPPPPPPSPSSILETQSAPSVTFIYSPLPSSSVPDYTPAPAPPASATEYSPVVPQPPASSDVAVTSVSSSSPEQSIPPQQSSASYLPSALTSYGVPTSVQLPSDTVTIPAPPSASSATVSIPTPSGAASSVVPVPPSGLTVDVPSRSSAIPTTSHGDTTPQSSSFPSQASGSEVASSVSQATSVLPSQVSNTVSTAESTFFTFTSASTTIPSSKSSTSESSSVIVVNTSVRSTLSSTAAPASSTTAQETGIPPAPSAGGASNSLSGRGKERVWWVAFFVPLIFAL